MLRSIPMMLLAFAIGCGGEGYITSPPPARQNCPSEDYYLGELYQLMDEGKLDNLKSLVEEELSFDLQSQLVLALLELVTYFEANTIETVQTTLDRTAPNPETYLAIANGLRWVASTGPAAPYQGQLAVFRTILNTCEGAPILGLLRDVVREEALISTLFTLLDETDLSRTTEPFDPANAEEREAFRALLSNVLATASSEHLDVEALIQLLGTIVELDSESGQSMKSLLETFLSQGPQRDALQQTLRCFRVCDPDNQLADLIYDALGSAGPDLSALELSAPGNDTLQSLGTLLDYFATDGAGRRAFAAVLTGLMLENRAAGVLSDIANLLEAGAIEKILELALNLSSKTCAK